MSEGRRFCENCGREVGQTTNFCPNCGAAQRPDPDVPTGPPPYPPEPGRISTEDAPNVPPPPKQPKRNTLRNIIIVLIALIVLIIAGRACGSGGETSSEVSPPAPESDAKEEEKKEEKKEKKNSKQDQATTVAIGQPVTAGDIEWTVTNARAVNELSQDAFGQFGKTKQGNFVVVDLLFTNNGSDPSTLTTQSLTLLDSNDRESRPDTDTFGYIENERNIFLEQVNPGVTREGTVIFTVSPDASDFRLRVGDANMFSREEAYVDLGF